MTVWVYVEKQSDRETLSQITKGNFKKNIWIILSLVSRVAEVYTIQGQVLGHMW